MTSENMEITKDSGKPIRILSLNSNPPPETPPGDLRVRQRNAQTKNK